MEDNDKCIILKKNEYKELLEKANGNKPDYIEVYLYVDRHGRRIASSLKFSERLDRQIRRLIILALNQVELAEGEIMKNTKEGCYKKLAEIPWYKRRKFLRQYE